MSVLKILENGLIPIFEVQNSKLVNGRDLHVFLEVGTKFTDWIKERIEKYGFVENEDFITTSEKREVANGGYKMIVEYLLKLDTAKEISMVQNNEKGSEARKYFIFVEKKFKQVLKPLCIEDVLIQSLKEMKDMKSQIQEVKKQASLVGEEVQDIRETVIIIPKDWRKYCVDTLRKIAANNNLPYEDVNNMSYKALISKGCNLERRLKGRKERAEQLGVAKSKVDKFNYLDCIGEDKKLTDIYLNIVKRMAIKYKVK